MPLVHLMFTPFPLWPWDGIEGSAQTRMTSADRASDRAGLAGRSHVSTVYDVRRSHIGFPYRDQAATRRASVPPLRNSKIVASDR